jgi:hypothetical protein
MVGLRQRQHLFEEGDRIDPGECIAAIAQLLRDDPPARLRDDGMAAPSEFVEQRRLAAAGAARQDDETVYAAIRQASCSPA